MLSQTDVEIIFSGNCGRVGPRLVSVSFWIIRILNLHYFNAPFFAPLPGWRRPTKNKTDAAFGQ